MEPVRKPSLSCPKCRRDTEVLTLDPRTSVDFCGACKGMWLDRGELARSVGAARDLPDPDFCREQATVTVHSCPRCPSERLHQFAYARDSSVVVDGCLKCEGLFFDFREFPQVQARLKQAPFVPEPVSGAATANVSLPGSIHGTVPGTRPGFGRMGILVGLFSGSRANRRLKWALLLLPVFMYQYSPNVSFHGMPSRSGTVTDPAPFSEVPVLSHSNLPGVFERDLRLQTYRFEPQLSARLAGTVVGDTREFFGKDGPLFPRSFRLQSAGGQMNVSIFPDSVRMRAVLLNVRKGDRIVLEGSLVNVSRKSGYGRRSSSRVTWITGTSVGEIRPFLLHLTRVRVNDAQF